MSSHGGEKLLGLVKMGGVCKPMLCLYQSVSDLRYGSYTYRTETRSWFRMGKTSQCVSVAPDVLILCLLDQLPGAMPTLSHGTHS